MIRQATASDEPEIRECAELAYARYVPLIGRKPAPDAVHLYTNAKMTENLSIYPKLGYSEVGRRIEDGFKRVYFEKKLA